MKKDKLVKGEIYHIFNKSIANFGIFDKFDVAHRFINALDYYNSTLVNQSLYNFLKKNPRFECKNLLLPKDYSYIKYISYCIMPDHYHLLIKILIDNIFTKYINDVENSFSRYFNIRFNRKGPLWQSSFQSVRIRSNEQLLHVSRYIHLNPTTNGLVSNPEEWPLSSYEDYIHNKQILSSIMNEISIKNPKYYQKFVEDQKDYQRKLGMIKRIILE